MTVDNVKHEELITLQDARRAAALSAGYCAYAVRSSDILKQLQADRWCRGFILTDVVKDPKDKTDEGNREDVSFVFFVEGDKFTPSYRKRKQDLPKLLAVRYFAMTPWYSEDWADGEERGREIVVKWIRYLISVIQRDRRDFTKVCWPVDEYDTPLQVELKKQGFKYVRTYASNSATLFNNGRYDEELGRMLFVLE